jgi:hypothetical protein
VELHALISTGDFRTLNRWLDDPIVGAVTEYGRERNQPGDFLDHDAASASESDRAQYYGAAFECRRAHDSVIRAGRRSTASC